MQNCYCGRFLQRSESFLYNDNDNYDNKSYNNTLYFTRVNEIYKKQL